MQSQSVYISSAATLAFACSLLSQPGLISESPLASSTAAGGSFAPIISGNGRYIVYTSHANNLVGHDHRGNALDVFAREVTTSETRLLTTAAGPAGDRPYFGIAHDGQTIVFSFEINDGPSQSFVYRWGSNSTTLLSTANGSSEPASAPLGVPGYDGTTKPQVSRNGRWVTFESTATNLVANDTNDIADVFLRDMESGETVLISTGAQGTSRARSFGAAVAETGRRVAFVSTANGLVPAFSNAWGEIYVRDVAIGTTFRGSSNVTSYLLSPTNVYSCLPPVISTNGSAIAFKVREGARVLVFHHSLETEVTTLLSSNGLSRTFPAMTADGQRVAFEDSQQIVLWDASSGSRTVITTGFSAAIEPVITPDGAVMAFLGKTNSNDKFQLYLRDLQGGVTRLISRNSEGSPSTAGVNTVPSLSSDGRRVVFDYYGNDLAPNDVNRASDVFLFDADLYTVELLSRRLPDQPSLTSASWSIPQVNSISDNGRLVTYESYDVPGLAMDTNRARDAFVRDLVSGGTTPLSLLPDNTFGPRHRVRQPLISGNGKHAIFMLQSNQPPSGGIIDLGPMRLFYRNLELQSTEEVDPQFIFNPIIIGSGPRATTFPAISRDGEMVCYEKNGQLYVRRMSTTTNEMVTVRWDGFQSWYPPAVDPRFSLDGRWVSFKYHGLDLLATGSTLITGTNLYGRDVVSKSTKLLSVGEAGERLFGSTYDALFYADDRLLFWGTYGTNEQVQGAMTRAYLHNLAQTNSTLVCLNCTSVTPSSDGRYIVFLRQRPGPQRPVTNDVYMKDLTFGTETLITSGRFGSELANEDSLPPTISSDGRYVIYASRATNLSLHDTNNALDIFAYDRLRQSNIILTPNANAGSSLPVIAGDGRSVVFQSMASNLVPGDFNGGLDVFYVRLGGGDSDNDGMDDNWEVTYFNDLARNGETDLDMDGQSDLSEFLAGTDPTNVGSLLEVLTIRSAHNGGVQVVWSSVVGRRYVVQRKDSLANPNWASVSPEVIATDVTASWSHDATVGTGFYRVVVENQ